MKKKIMAIIAAAAMCLTGCGGNDTPEQIPETEETTTEAASEETTAPEESINLYETLAEGQERDWNIEDVLKNDLEIDGIPVSIPCTIDELLSTLGDEYNIVDNHSLLYNNEDTMLSISVFPNENNTVCGFLFVNLPSLYDKGVLEFTNLDSTYDSFINVYTNPNELTINKNMVTMAYSNEICYFDCIFVNDAYSSIHIGYKIGGNE